jgi:hypothetical protein
MRIRATTGIAVMDIAVARKSVKTVRVVPGAMRLSGEK